MSFPMVHLAAAACGNVSTGYSSKALSSNELWEKAGRGGSISRDELGLSKGSSSSSMMLE